MSDRRTQLIDLARRVDRLCPDRSGIERFFEERDEIKREMEDLARTLPRV